MTDAPHFSLYFMTSLGDNGLIMLRTLLRSGHFQLLVAVVFWGFSYVSIKVVLAHLSPVEMISARLVLASLVLAVVIRMQRKRFLVPSGWGRLWLMSGVVFMDFWVMATGMLEVSASDTAWILTTAPIFIAILSWLFLREPFSGWQWAGLLIAGAGVIALSYNGNPANLQWHSSRGELIVLGSCVTWAVYTVGTRSLTSSVDPLVATFWMSALAALVFTPLTLFTSGIKPFADLPPDTLLHLLFLGVGCLGIAFWLWSEGLKRQPAAEVGIYLYLEPLVTVAGAWWIFGQSPTIWLLFGAALICAGVFVAESLGKAKPLEHDAGIA